jgi:NAD(P)-dependent dehydrogenase (short-subunit alcohol dehydrogenase family)
MSAQELRGTRTLVINGTTGVGPAVVRAFSERGADVTVAAAQASPGLPCDLAHLTVLEHSTTDPEQAERLFRRVGEIDVAVILANSIQRSDALSLPVDDVEAVIREKLTTPMVCIREAAKGMAERGGGRVITFISMSGKTGTHEGVAVPAASMAGLIGFSRSLAVDLAPRAVTVNVIATALFHPNASALPPERQEHLLGGIPVGRFGDPEEAAHAALFLASPKAAFVTGETLNLSGGRFMD